MKLVAQMDEISSINIKTDSTFAILLEAQNRGHEIFYYLPKDLNFDVNSGNVSSLVKKIELKNEARNHFKIIEEKVTNLTEFDVILVRQDPPFDMNYITSTYILEKIKDQVLILNDPSEIRNCPEKLFVTDFPEFCPPTLISCNIKAAREFHKKYEKIILKPLYSRGGDGIILLEKDDKNLNSAFELLLKAYQTPAIIQKFLPEINHGDKRIILIDGEPVGAVSRVAAANEIRSNLHIGGSANKTELTKREIEICQKIAPELKKRGLFFVGIDVIGDYLTEINVTSPTCIQEINELNGGKIEEIILEKIEKLKS